MWIVGSGSLANVASFTPGSVGVTQATNALALETCCHVAKNTTIAYSTAQQLITTAWNVLFATALVVIVFGWTGGKQLVGDAYVDAKDRAADMKEERKQKRADRRAARKSSDA
jgi:IS5 family transposase